MAARAVRDRESRGVLVETGSRWGWHRGADACRRVERTVCIDYERANAPEGIAPKRASLFELDDDGLIRRMYFVLASRKLTALPGLAN